MKRFRGKLPLILSVVARTASFAALGITTQLYLRELGATRFWVGMSTTLAWAAIMLFSRFWGTLSDILLRRRDVILLAAAGSTAMTLVLVASRSVPVVLVGRFLVEALGAGVPPAAMALLSSEGGAASRGRRMGVFTVAQAVGLLSGSVLGGFLSTVLAFRSGFLVITAVSSLGTLGALFVTGEAGIAETGEISWRALLRKTLPSFNAVRSDEELSACGLTNLYLGIVLRKAGIVGVYGLLMVFLQEKRNITPFVSGSLSAINPALQVLSMPMWAPAADRLGRKRVLLVGYALSIATPLMMLLSNAFWLLIGAFVVLGVGFAAFITGATTFIGDVAPPEKEGELMGLVKVSQGFGGLIGPVIAGAVSSPTVGGYDGMFVTMAGLMLTGLLITALGTRESRPAGARRSEKSAARST
jgi:MFS family permease